MSKNQAFRDDDLLWGIGEIAKEIRRTKRQTEYMIAKQIIPVTKLSSKIIVGSRRQIRRQLGSEISEQA
jgi:hypothetical protein